MSNRTATDIARDQMPTRRCRGAVQPAEPTAVAWDAGRGVFLIHADRPSPRPAIAAPLPDPTTPAVTWTRPSWRRRLAVLLRGVADRLDPRRPRDLGARS